MGSYNYVLAFFARRILEDCSFSVYQRTSDFFELLYALVEIIFRSVKIYIQEICNLETRIWLRLRGVICSLIKS